MFYRSSYVVLSDILNFPGVSHGFATREGGVSLIPEVASMNLAPLMGDSPENAEKNVSLLASYAGLEGYPVIYGSQIHSTVVQTVTLDDTDIFPDNRKCDGYVTDVPGIALLVRAADCVPILLCGKKADSSPVIGAVHAGWRGTVGEIAAVAVEKMAELGAEIATVRAAVGPSIHDCCFEVKEDFISSVTEMAGKNFAGRHIHNRDGKYFASLQDMNVEIHESAGITPDRIDVSPDCTAHMGNIYHSHRATKGNRGVGGGIIGINK